MKHTNPPINNIWEDALTDRNNQPHKRKNSRIGNIWDNTELKEVLNDVSTDADVAIIPDVSLDLKKRVILILNEVPLEVALDAICLTTDSIWKKTPYFYWIMPRTSKPLGLPYPLIDAQSSTEEQSGALINMTWKEASLQDILFDTSFEAGVNIAIAPQVEGHITIDIRNLPLEAALDKICGQTNCTWKKTPYYYVITK